MGREPSLRPGQEADFGRIALKQNWRTSVRGGFLTLEAPNGLSLAAQRL